MNTNDFDCLVVGAGPAGTSFAKTFAHKNPNKKVAVFEKRSFPRDKVCGDAISNVSLSLLNDIFPELAGEIPTKSLSKKITIQYPNGSSISMNDAEHDIIPRKHFDHLLRKSLHPYKNIVVFENTCVDSIIKTNQKVSGLKVTINNKTECFTAPLILAADGSHSIVRRQTGSINEDEKHTAVRQYIKGLSNYKQGIYIYLDPEYDGYFWVFPIEKNKERWANIGYGTKKTNPLTRFNELKNLSPVKDYLLGTEEQSKINGFPLNFASVHYSKIKLNRPLWGEGYILLGDAACLIHPFTGEGISLAMYSGKIAAELFAKGLNGQELGKLYQTKILNFIDETYDLKHGSLLFGLPCQLPSPVANVYMKLIPKLLKQH